MSTKKKASKKAVKPSKPEKVMVNQKITLAEKANLEKMAERYSGGNVTKLIRLLAQGKFQPVKTKK